jgi:hypothetical protein
LAKPRTSKRRPWGNREEARQIKAIDELSAFEEFKAEILPALRVDLKNGVPPEAILKKYQSIAAARTIMSVVGKNEITAAKCARDVLDRTMGKPVETRVEKHRYEDLNSEQMNSLLQSKFDEMKRAAPAAQSTEEKKK